jgi:hypothetical protein
MKWIRVRLFGKGGKQTGLSGGWSMGSVSCSA